MRRRPAGHLVVAVWPFRRPAGGFSTGAHVSEYHADTPDYAFATVVPVTAGVSVSGIDAALAAPG